VNEITRAPAPGRSLSEASGERYFQVSSEPAGALREMNPMPKLDNETILLAFVAVTGLAVLLQAFILLAILVSVRKATRSIKEELEDLRSAAMPVIYNTRELFTRLAPIVEDTVGDLSQIAHGLRVQTEEMQSSASEIIEKVRVQTTRLDAMFTGVLDAIDRAGGFVAEAVSKPVRQLSALAASIKAIVESLRVPGETARPARPRDDKDMFV
jgi:hypothetical protein